MNILIVSTLKRKITSRITASRPRVIYDISSGLIKKGHKVSILGTGDSDVPGAKIITVIPKGFIDMPAYENPFNVELGFIAKSAKMMAEISKNYDIVHNHNQPEFVNMNMAKYLPVPMVTTFHTQMTPEFDEMLSCYSETNIICISKASKKLTRKAKISAVVYNGIDTNYYKFHKHKKDYLLWVGRLGKAKDKTGKFIDAKGVRWAIKLARETGSNLKLVANVEDVEFYNRDVKPYLSKKIQWIGPISKEQPLSKLEIIKLMQKAKAFLMTVNWYEAFGLVMAEAMSCGTPVIGFDRGSVSELVVDGKTGFVVKPEKGINGLIAALKKIDRIKPEDCRERVEKNFSLENMVNSYEKVYINAINKWKKNRTIL